MLERPSASTLARSLHRSVLFVLLLVGTASVQAQTLRFLQPTNGAVYSMRDEIPIVLRSSVPDDVLLSADVFANLHQKIGTAVYCCPICLCVRPEPGQEITLQIPASYQNGEPPSGLFRGWTNVPAGEYRLTAKGVSEKGTSVEATPVNITVVDRELNIYRNPEGGLTFSIAMGAMVLGRYDLEESDDLQSWALVGPFSPGNVGAFYWDKRPADSKARFFRSVFVPPPNQ